MAACPQGRGARGGAGVMLCDFCFPVRGPWREPGSSDRDAASWKWLKDGCRNHSSQRCSGCFKGERKTRSTGVSLQTDQRDRGAILHFLWGTLPRCLSPRSLAEPRSGLPVPSLFISLVSRPTAEEGAQGRVANSRAAQRHPALLGGGGLPCCSHPPTGQQGLGREPGDRMAKRDPGRSL